MTENPPALSPIQRRMQKQGPLSYSQESLWFLQQLDPSNIAYNSAYLFRITGGVDPQIMEHALNEIVRRHENLRTVYPIRGGQPLMLVRPHESFMLPFVDYSSLLKEEQETVIREYAVEHGNVAFNLFEGPLTRFALLHTAPKEDYLFVAIHHIGFDAWSRQVLIGELVQLYGAYRTGLELGLPDLPVQFIDYALWQRDWLSGDTLTSFIDHWKNILCGELPTLDLPTDHPRPAMQTYRGARHHFGLSPAISTKVRQFCQKEHLTSFHFFLAAYAVLLMRYTGQEDLITGCPFANRPFSELDGIIGAFINTLPIRLNLSNDPSVRDFLGQVRAVMLDAFSWQAVPFETLVSELSLQRDLSRTPVFQVLINMRNVPKRSHAIDGLDVEIVLREDASAAFDVSLELGDEGDHFSAAIRYNTSLFDQTTILHMASHYQNIISAMLERPEDPISELEMLSSSERQRLLLDWNETRSEYPQVCVHQLISGQAAKNPDGLAVICNGNNLTYSTLERKANQLAAYLLAKGLKPGALVGIFLPRSEELLVTQLAILKAGGAYVPFDLTYPVERLAYILQDANPALVITHSSLGAQLPNHCLKIILDAESDAIRAFPNVGSSSPSDGDAILYVTYTSGSTGRPKGVMTVQRGVMNYLHHLVKTFNFKAEEKVIQFTPLSFDAAFRDTLGVLTFGGTVVLMDDGQMHDPDFIRSAILEQQVTGILSVVPTMLRALAHSILGSRTSVYQLRFLMPSGEALQEADIELVRNAFGKAVQIVNQYGPTECSMISTLYTVPANLPEGVPGVPIGKPISNVRVYVLDQYRQPVPVGVRGELYIGGIGVSPGYLNQPVLTADRFFPDPYWSGGRMYCTGDLVQYSPDGILSFLGRRDNQVKIRGYRVELEEIEAVIRECPGIQDAAVVVLRSDKHQDVLVAYITLSGGKREPITGNLQRYLADRLPFYMLPSSIKVLDGMPLTPNGKIDRAALPRLESIAGEDRYLAPGNDTEKRLVSIWKELLGVERIGIRDNFFELGGHSLLAVRLFSRIQEEFGQSLPLLLLFKEGTVEAIARSLTVKENPTLPQGIVPIRSEGSEPPLFIVSAGLYMHELVLGLAPVWPVYGVDPFENGKVVYRKSVQETAKIFYRNLVDFYPQGPYSLLAHSAYGYFALELARLLVQSGKKVNFLGLLDTYPPGRRRQANLADRVKIHILNLQGKDFPAILQYIGRSAWRFLTRWRRRAVVDAGLIKYYEKKTQVKEVRNLLLRAYNPEPYEGQVTLFTATHRPWYMRWDPMEHWANILTGKLEIIPIPGDHMSALTSPHLDLLARKIESLLRQHDNE